MYSTDSRKNFTSIESFITEPNSRAQSIALEENVKEFGLTYFGITDRRQGKQDSLAPITTRLLSCRSIPGIVHIIGPEQGFTVCNN
jgi:3-isopropylmalate dehydratase